MTAFNLPKGYSLTPPAAEESVTVPGETLYGGADISDHYDAASNHYVLCCATGPGVPAFRLRCFRRPKDGTVYSEVPLPIVATGRGNSDIQWIDGELHVAGFEGPSFLPGTVQGFAHFPSIPALDQRITALEHAAPAGDASAIANLQRIIDSQQQQLAAIETMLGTLGAGDLSPEDSQALAWLRELRALLRSA